MSRRIAAAAKQASDQPHDVDDGGKHFAGTAMQTGNLAHRRRYVWGAVVMIVALVSIGGALAMQARWTDGRMSVEDVVESLRSGEFHLGMQLPLSKLPKPWVADAQRDENKTDLSAVYACRDDNRVVLLYHSAGVVFAACTIEGSPIWSEKWYFYDADLLRSHIEWSMKSYSRPMLEIEEAGADAKQSNGPLLAVWPDGLMAISSAFPRYSPEFRLSQIDVATIMADLQRIEKQFPIPLTADEPKVRMALWTSNGDTKTLTQHILPVCILNLDCPDRLGVEDSMSWKQFTEALESAVKDGLSDRAAEQRAENYWNDHKPES